MNTLKNKFVAGGIVVVLSATAAGAFAKGGWTDSEKSAQRGTNLSYIFTELALDEQQQADVNAVLEAHREQTQEARDAMRQAMRNSEQRPDREEMQAVRDENRAAQLQALTDELNQVLSADDTEDLVAYLEAHQGGRGGDHRGDHRGDRDGRMEKGDRSGKDGRFGRSYDADDSSDVEYESGDNDE